MSTKEKRRGGWLFYEKKIMIIESTNIKDKIN